MSNSNGLSCEAEFVDCVPNEADTIHEPYSFGGMDQGRWIKVEESGGVGAGVFVALGEVWEVWELESSFWAVCGAG